MHVMAEASQERFETVYRGRQSFWHHASYMRMAKVLFGLWMLQKSKFHAENKKIFDYGFGAGTMFRFFPKNAQLFGVEQDPKTCQEVAQTLEAAGFRHVHLAPIKVGQEDSNPLLSATYDLVILSHVLEHLPDPAGFLRKMKGCLSLSGMILGLVPINERASNPHHLQLVDYDTVKTWAAVAGFKILGYAEGDPWLYWWQPLYTHDRGWRHIVAKGVSLGLGIPATFCGPQLWHFFGKFAGKLFSARPTQAAFPLAP